MNGETFVRTLGHPHTPLVTMANPLSRFLDPIRQALFDRGARPVDDLGAADSRRQFFRRAGIGAIGAVGTGMMLPDDAWAATVERANEFGITPGTVVDAQGKLIRRRPNGAEPFVGEIMLTPYNFPVRSYALCQGQIQAISQNSALFSLLGTTYGGDGQVTFGLPDLQGRLAMGWGNGPGLSPNQLGQKGGVENVTLTTPEMPAHNHAVTGTVTIPSSNAGGTTNDPNGQIIAGATGRGGDRFAVPSAANGSLADTALNAQTSVNGGSQPHTNMPPYLVLNYQIALYGIFPSRS